MTNVDFKTNELDSGGPIDDIRMLDRSGIERSVLRFSRNF